MEQNNQPELLTETPPKPTKPKDPKVISRSELDQKANEISESRKLPKTPGLSPDPSQLEAWLKLLTPDMVSHLKGYLYRLYPVIIRKLVNPEADKYIDVMTDEWLNHSQGFVGYVKSLHGGGKYQVIINDIDKNRGETLIKCHITIPLDDALPKLDYNELDLQNDKNLSYISLLRSKGILDGKGVPVAPTPVIDNSANATAQLANQVITMLSKTSESDRALLLKTLESNNKENNKDRGTDITALLLEKLKQENPNNQVAMLTGLVTAMKEMIPKPSAPIAQDNHSIDKLLEIQSKAHSESMQLMGKMMEMNQSKPQEDNFIDKLLKYREALPGLFGGSAAPEGKKQLAEVIVDGIKDIGLPVLGLASQLIQMRTGVKPIVPVTSDQAQEMVDNGRNPNGYDPRQPQQPPQINASSNLPNLPNQRPNVVSMPNPQTQQPPNVDPNQPSAEMTICQKLLVQYGNLLITPIKAGMSGVEMGEKFKSFGGLLGQDVYAILKGQGKNEIIYAMESLPPFWDQTGKVMGKEHMEKLVDDFLNFEEILEELDQDQPELAN